MASKTPNIDRKPGKTSVAKGKAPSAKPVVPFVDAAAAAAPAPIVPTIEQAVIAPAPVVAAPAAAPVVPAPVIPAEAETPPANEKASAELAPTPADVPAVETAAILPEPTPPAAPAIDAAPAAITKEVTIMNDTINTATETVQNNAQDAAAKARTMFADASTKTTRAFEDMTAFNKGNVEALVESSKIVAKGLETMGQDAAEFGRRQFEGATAALKNMSSVKSPTDFMQLHSEFVRSSFDQLVAQSSKNTEALLKLAGEVSQPIQNRVAVAVEKAKVAA